MSKALKVRKRAKIRDVCHLTRLFIIEDNSFCPTREERLYNFQAGTSDSIVVHFLQERLMTEKSSRTRSVWLPAEEFRHEVFFESHKLGLT